MNFVTDGSVTSPKGFRAAAAACSLKPAGELDLALLASERDCTAAGVFTRNQIVAAPVIVSRETLAAGRSRIRGVVVNSGNANACTGELGMAAAREMQRLAAEQIACDPAQVLVLSTGVIGVLPDLGKLQRGITDAAGRLAAGGGAAAARAIMTTDTHPKQIAVQVELPGGVVTIAGMAKGAGMIHPNMATMLGVFATDAAVPAALLQDCLTAAVEQSFNRISVDGDTSTNDAVLLLANGASSVALHDPPSVAAFSQALSQVCAELARMIVRDGEGATRLVELLVTGARSEGDALQVANTVATSPLVKTAIAGGDPNWGRILAAAGRAGVPLDPNRIVLSIGTAESQLRLFAAGVPLDYREPDAHAIFSQPEFQVRLDLGLGDQQVTVWTCDLTHEYVTINAHYRT